MKMAKKIHKKITKNHEKNGEKCLKSFKNVQNVEKIPGATALSFARLHLRLLRPA
jgi:hypothetical protein